ncbi:MAG: hypothetical protein ISEC1_P1768 [Thiomicrorhabdus sp.]|nr:MAG: hypothetical protein ISEC1_P1768 [Thiomicrorhabdus sp.]
MKPDNVSRDTKQQAVIDSNMGSSREATVCNSVYQVEYDGSCYIVMKRGQALMSFDSCDSAFDAKRDFETTKYPKGWDKIPPAMQAAKRLIYGEQ